MGARPPKAVGSYGLLDVIRQPGRLGQSPPEPSESLADVRAVERGEFRRVSCFLREPRGDGWRGPRQGVLELSRAGASWRPWPSFGVRKSRVLDVTGVVLVRPAERSDQYLGSPVNLHLFSLVRCVTPVGRLDLLVPAADVPLVSWTLGGYDGALAEASALSPRLRQHMSSREVRLRAVSGLALVMVALLVIAAGLGALCVLPMNLGAFLMATAALGRRRARRGGEGSAAD